MPRIVLLGAPGAGKSSHSACINKALGIPAIASGDILRDNVKKGTEYGKQAERHIEAGELVPDELIIAIIMKRLNEDDAKNGFLLDGFPRTIAQAEALCKSLAKTGEELDYVLFLNAPKEIFVNRIASRRFCPACGGAFRLDDIPEEVCRTCGVNLVQRDDDDAKTVANRIDVFEKQTAPLVEYYKEQGLLVEIDASFDIDTVQVQINKGLGIE